MSFSALFKGIRRVKNQPAPPQLLPPPTRCFVPMRQHRGSICNPTVEPGQRVQVGQVVGSSEAFDAALVHAPVSGEVDSLLNLPDAGGLPIPTVVIRSDGQDDWLGDQAIGRRQISEPTDLVEFEPERLLHRIQQAGLVRTDLQGRSLYADLAPPRRARSFLLMTGQALVRGVDTLIIRGVDKDPPMAPNESLLPQVGNEFAVGVAAMARISGASRVIIVVPSGSDYGAAAAIAAEHEWEVLPYSNPRYPYARTLLLVHALTGRMIPTPFGLPREVGVMVEPLITAVNLGKVLLTKRPVIEQVVSVAGEVNRPGTFLVRLGTPMNEVLEAAGGPKGEMGKVIVGGPMMGLSAYDLCTPVTKETTGLFVQGPGGKAHYTNEPCIHCGRCAASCPVNLVPSELSKLCEFGHYEQAAHSDLFHCIECGVCSYVCPARRSMVHLFRHGKSELMGRRRQL